MHAQAGRAQEVVTEWLLFAALVYSIIIVVPGFNVVRMDLILFVVRKGRMFGDGLATKKTAPVRS